MQRKKLEKLQKHLRTLKLFKVKESNGYQMLLRKIDDETRFSIRNWTFECGMPACVAGHAGYIFNWKVFAWERKFKKFFGLSDAETGWIVNYNSYKSLNPTPETAAKHIQDVLDRSV